MIFLSLGTHEMPFDRAVDWVLEARPAGEEILVQHGATRPRLDEPGTTWREYLSYDEMRASVRSARHVVCHAGVGTVISVAAEQRRPLVIARVKRNREHVDDHQLELAEAAHRMGLILWCQSSAELADGLAEPPVDVDTSGLRGDSLREAVAQAVADGPRGRPPSPNV